MANVIEQAAKAIRSRLAELVGEQQQLQKALGASRGCSDRSAAEPRRRPPPRPAGVSGGAARRRAPDGSPRRRRRGGPSRADQFLELVAERPGITVAEAAERLDASRQTLYNVSARLQREGRIRKHGRGFYTAEQPPAPAPQEGAGPPPASAHNSLYVAIERLSAYRRSPLSFSFPPRFS